MVDGLDADDLRFERRVMRSQKPQELQLCSGGSDQENITGGSKRGRDVSEEVRHIARMVVLGAGSLRVPMKMMLRRRDLLGLELFGVHAKDTRLLMVEPHDGLMSLHGTP